MAPERSPKRQKTSSGITTSSTAVEPSQIPLPFESSTQNLVGSPESAGQQTQGSSWYSSWSRKTPPVAQVAKEGINLASNAASEVAASIRDVTPRPASLRSPSLAMTLGKGRSNRATLADATTTIIHAEARSPARSSTRLPSTDSKIVQTPREAVLKTDSTDKRKQEEPKLDEPSIKQKKSLIDATQDEQNPRSSWLGWLAKGDGVPASQSKDDNAQIGSGPSTDTVGMNITEQDAQVTQQPKAVPEHTAPEEQSTSAPIDQSNKRGWLPIWRSEPSEKVPNGTDDIQTTGKPSEGSNCGLEEVRTTSDIPQASQPAQKQPPSSSVTNTAPSVLAPDGTKATGWAFWSRDRTANQSSTSVDKPREGEIAISDTPSQNQPRRTSISVSRTKVESKSEPKKPESKKSETSVLSEGNRLADPITSKATETSAKGSHKKQDSNISINAVKAEGSSATAVSFEPTNDKKPAAAKSDRASNNILLPSLHETLRIPESPSLLLRLASLFYSVREPDQSYLSLVKDPPRIKSALAIGVHGYFPVPLIRSVLGQPTGTSLKFADMAAKSIKRWTSGQGYECQVKTAALEGEGKIAERVDLLWKLLLNWIEEIRNSDFIMVACHSQGVPVAIMLVAKLIQFGCVSASRVCICAMAGVNMGPFQEYKSRWIGGSAGELFEFSDPSSRVSTDYLAALDVVLKFGVRLTFIGSIDDQLVSLESSIFSPLCHPHIFRAVSIDSRIHAPNFLSHLVGLALKLRNLGIQDHGLIRELSSPLAGSLYTGEGHSRIYEDDAVYDLAVAFSMETTALPGIPLSQKTAVAGSSNPYILPFAMRGILEEDIVKTELQDEASDLLKEFDSWKPTSKVLKDVKFRLEGIRSRS